MNNIRTKTLIKDSDIVVVRFGDKYRQWNAAFDAGYAAAMGKSIITLHPPNISHMLKEVNANASAVCEDAEQVVDTLAYVIRGIFQRHLVIVMILCQLQIDLELAIQILEPAGSIG